MIFKVYHFKDSESGRFNTYLVESNSKPNEEQVTKVLNLDLVESNSKPNEEQVTKVLNLDLKRYEKIEIVPVSVVKI
jgi:hypothetical protein